MRLAFRSRGERSESRRLRRAASELRKEGRHEAALDLLAELVDKFGESSDPETRENVVWGMLGQAHSLLLVGRQSDQLTTYDDLIHRFREDKRPGSREAVARAANLEAAGLFDTGSTERAARIWTHNIKRFGADASPAIRRVMAETLLIRATRLLPSHPNEALTDFREIIGRHVSEPDLGLAPFAACAMAHIAKLLMRQGDYRGAETAAKETRAIFGSKAWDLHVEQWIAYAGALEVEALVSLGEPDLARRAMDRLLEEHGNSLDGVAAKSMGSYAVNSIANAEAKAGRHEIALSDARNGKAWLSDRASLLADGELAVPMAWLTTTEAEELIELDRSAEALVVIDGLLASGEDVLRDLDREVLANLECAKGVALSRLGDWATALVWYDRALDWTPGEDDGERPLARWLTNRAEALAMLGRRGEAAEACARVDEELAIGDHADASEVRAELARIREILVD